MTDLIGSTIGGCKITELFAQTDLGAFYTGLQSSLKRPVSLWLIPVEKFGGDQARVKNFKGEIATLSQINHPNLVHIYNTGKKKEHYYVIMQELKGTPLTKAVQEQDGLTIDQAGSIAQQIASALEVVLSRGIIHGNLCPDIVFINPEGVPQIAGFGYEREEIDLLSSTVTPNQTFMSPERNKGESLDPRSDIYSIGALLYYMVTASLPYNATNPAELNSLVEGPGYPPLPETLGKRALSELTSFIEKCMPPGPEGRYQTYSELQTALSVFSGGAPAAAAPAADGRPEGLGADSPGLGSPAGGSSGTVECPECKTVIDQPQIEEGKVICPMCSARFVPEGAGAEQAGFDDALDLSARDRRATGSVILENVPDSLAPQPSVSDEQGPENLEDRIRKVILLQPKDAVTMIVGIIDAVQVSSPGNIILPENVILGDGDKPEVKPCKLEYPELSPEGAFFASPELCKGNLVAESSHAYSLGIMILYMLSGHLPYEEPDTEQIKIFHLSPKNISPSKLNPAVSPTLERIILLMLGAQDAPRMESLDELKTLLSNELMRIDGVDVQDRVSEPIAPAPQQPQPPAETPEQAPAGDQVTETASVPKKEAPVSITCSNCGELNIPQDFLCKGCGKPLFDENPSLEITQESDFVHLGMVLNDRGNLGDAMSILKKGADAFPNSPNIRNVINKVEAAMTEKNAQIIAKGADDFAANKKYAKAITDWKRAGEMSEEIKTASVEKIKWAESQMRKRKLITISAVLLIMLGIGITAILMYPEQIATPVYNLFSNYNMRLRFIERYVPEDRPDLSGTLSMAEMLGYLEKYKDKVLTDKGIEDRKAVKGLLIKAVEEKLPVARFWEFLKLIETVSKYPGDAITEEKLTELKLASLEAYIIECVSFTNTDRDIIVADLKKLIPIAAGTRLEQKLDDEIKNQLEKIKKEGDELVIARARGEINKGKEYYSKGDYPKAQEVFKQILREYNDPEVFAEIHREVHIRLDKIRKYEERADDLLAKAEISKLKKDFGNYINLARQILKEYPYSKAASRVKVPFRITSVPGNARVEIDGNPVGTTPCNLNLSPRAENEIRVYLDGYIEKRFRLADMVFSPEQKDWVLDLTLAQVETAVVKAGEKLQGLGYLGEMFYSAGTESVFCFYPFSKENVTKKIAYPPTVETPKKEIIQFSPFSEEYSACIRRNNKLIMFNPITEYMTLIGDIRIQTGRPVTISPFYPSKNAGVFFRGSMGELFCYDAKDFTRKWTRRFKGGNTGTDLAVFKQFIVTEDPENKGIGVWSKDEGKLIHRIKMKPSRYALTIENGEIFACGMSGEFMRFNLIREKREKWRLQLPEKDGFGTVAPLVKGGDIILLSSKGICMKIHRRMGDIKWRMKITSKPLAGGVFFENSIYIYDISGTIYRLDSNGAVQGILYGREAISSGLLFQAGSMFFVTENGNFVRYAL